MSGIKLKVYFTKRRKINSETSFQNTKISEKVWCFQWHAKSRKEGQFDWEAL